MDLCFVPVQHTAAVKLPAVSGSSGQLVVARPQAAVEIQFLGRIFEDPEVVSSLTSTDLVRLGQVIHGGGAAQPTAGGGVVRAVSCSPPTCNS